MSVTIAGGTAVAAPCSSSGTCLGPKRTDRRVTGTDGIRASDIVAPLPFPQPGTDGLRHAELLPRHHLQPVQRVLEPVLEDRRGVMGIEEDVPHRSNNARGIEGV